MACPCKCPRCGRNIYRAGVLVGADPRGRVVKRCGCGAFRVGPGAGRPATWVFGSIVLAGRVGARCP